MYMNAKHFFGCLICGIAMAGLFWLPVSEGQTAHYIEGTHYSKLAQKQRTFTASDDKIEVIEFFWYGCKHCEVYAVPLKQWYEENEDTVQLVFTPVIWNDATRAHAKLYYVAKILGIEQKMHSVLFNTILGQRKPMRTKSEASRLFLKHGISPDAFDKAWSSFIVKNSVERVARNMQSYNIAGTPTLIINGEYSVGPNKNTSYLDTFKIADMLIERVLKNKGKATTNKKSKSSETSS